MRFKVKGDPDVDIAFPWLPILEHYSISSCLILVVIGIILTMIDEHILLLLGGLLVGLGAGILFMAGILRTALTKQVHYD